MFTGIIEAIGRVVRVTASPRHEPGGAPAHRLDVQLGELLDGLRTGASVAINGACLTLTERQGPVGVFDVIPETWQNTNLRLLEASHRVNVERSLRVGDRIDGHFVQGHVDGVGQVERIERAMGEWKLWLTADMALMPCIVRKGSIALDGISLTVVDVQGASFSVALIPTTLERTTLGQRKPGDLVNIETDILARLIVSRLANLAASDAPAGAGTGITLEHLQAGGFL